MLTLMEKKCHFSSDNNHNLTYHLLSEASSHLISRRLGKAGARRGAPGGCRLACSHSAQQLQGGPGQAHSLGATSFTNREPGGGQGLAQPHTGLRAGHQALPPPVPQAGMAGRMQTRGGSPVCVQATSFN